MKFAKVGIERNDLGPAACCLKRVPTGSAPEVKQPRSGLNWQPAEVHGQHGASVTAVAVE
jgi:hypothetical protein